MSDARPVPPDAVRVWRGFRAAGMSLDDFFDRLGSVFVPATVEMQVRVGLDAYVPTVPAGMAGKPATAPDETAVLFWDSQQTYSDGFKTLAVRTYTLTHGAVYTPESRADFPVPFDGALKPDQPVYLVDRPADWMRGTVTHLVGARPSGTGPEAFRTALAAALAGLRARPHLEGAVACAGDDYAVCWALGPRGCHHDLGPLAGLCGWSHVFTPEPTALPAGLWEDWPGMTIAPGGSFTMQFRRRGQQ